MNKLPSASVIVVCHNERDMLEGSMTALMQQDYPGAVEVLLVDDASTDGSGDYVRTHFPAVRVITCQQNRGFAVSNNLGASRAQGQVLAFLNADTKATPHWLRELIQPLLSDSQIGLTTSKVVLMDQPSVINACGNDISLTGVTTCRRAGCHTAAIIDDEEIPAVCGGAFAVRAAIFRQLGGFDEQLWPYLEDTDLSWRARLAGYRCVLAARSVVAHDYTLRIPATKARAIERNRYLLLAKNLSGRSLLALLPHFVLAEILTWGWALLGGPQFLWAKLTAVAWMATHLRLVGRVRRETQRHRQCHDRELLDQFPSLPPLTLIAHGRSARLAAALIQPLAVITRAWALWLIGHPYVPSARRADADTGTPVVVNLREDRL